MGEGYCLSADVFSFGIVLFELITRQKVQDTFPRDASTLYNLDYSKVEPYVPKDCPPDLLELALECCSKEPEKRPSFREIISKLNQIRGRLELGPTLIAPITPKKKQRSRSIIARSSPSRAKQEKDDEDKPPVTSTILSI